MSDRQTWPHDDTEDVHNDDNKALDTDVDTDSDANHDIDNEVDHEPVDFGDDNDGDDHLCPSIKEPDCKSFAKSLSRACDDGQLAL